MLCRVAAPASTNSCRATSRTCSFEVRVVQSAQRVEAVHGVADCNLAVDDACAHRAEHLAKLPSIDLDTNASSG
jgi:hypothetical protein